MPTAPAAPSLPFRDRPLDPVEFERLRLTLSSFRDGSGQMVLRGTGESMPGWRDFERTLASVVGGQCTESKGVLDIEVPAAPTPFGLSCKMAMEQPMKNDCILMELSNSAAKFKRHLESHHINWQDSPKLAGPEIVDLVTSWHYDLAGYMDIDSSYYAVLAHDAKWRQFRLLSYSLDLKIANPRGDVEWLIEGASLNGYVDAGVRRHRLWQCYMLSGGQLKYYPLMSWANWLTDHFQLEVPPAVSPMEKAERYFPRLWPR